MMKTGAFGSYRFGTCLDLDQRAMAQLFQLIETPPAPAGEILSGRACPVMAEMPGVGGVVIKQYWRGGPLRHINKYWHLMLRKTRPRREYEMLEEVRRLGVSSTEPLLWAVRGCPFYRAFLVTRKIEGHQSLSELGNSDPERCRGAVEKTANQIRLLIENRIHHVDLHPGNVLLDGKGRVHIIDFDKARRVSWDREKLRDAYIGRWKRAVEKYALPDFMTDQLIAGLAASNDLTPSEGTEAQRHRSTKSQN